MKRFLLFCLFPLCFISCSKDDPLSENQERFLKELDNYQPEKMYFRVVSEVSQDHWMTVPGTNLTYISVLVRYTNKKPVTENDYSAIGYYWEFTNASMYYNKQYVIEDAICVYHIDNDHYGNLPVFTSKKEYKKAILPIADAIYK